jgi:hypothetical protein
MDLLHTEIDLMAPLCILVEGTVALELWGLEIDRENILA